MKIDEKIDELIKLAEKEDDKNLIIILYALRGARMIHHDDELAKNIQRFIIDILMPHAHMDMNWLWPRR